MEAETHEAVGVAKVPFDYISEMEPGWLLFTVSVMLLVIMECWAIRKSHVVSLSSAFWTSLFWIGCGLVFNVGVYFIYGTDTGISWANGYLLEYMLSLDNLFIFHLMFEQYQTPEKHRRKALFYGIAGAIIFRLVFFAVTEFALKEMFVVHILLAAFLVYTGVKTMFSGDDDDEDSPSDNKCVQWMTSHIPMVDFYDEDGSFFVQVPEYGPTPGVSPNHSPETLRPAGNTHTIGKKVAPLEDKHTPKRGGQSHTPRDVFGDDDYDDGDETGFSRRQQEYRSRETRGDTDDAADEYFSDIDITDARKSPSPKKPNGIQTQTETQPQRMKLPAAKMRDVNIQVPGRVITKATPLLLVVLVCEVVDVVFAVDSVSAKAAQIPSLFVAYSSTVFAMFGLRNLFFVVQELVKQFVFMKYGLGMILVYIGVKLGLQGYVEIPEWVSFTLIIALVTLSVIASAIYNTYWAEDGTTEAVSGSPDQKVRTTKGGTKYINIDLEQQDDDLPDGDGLELSTRQSTDPNTVSPSRANGIGNGRPVSANGTGPKVQGKKPDWLDDEDDH